MYFKYLILYSCINFGIPLRSTFSCILSIPSSSSISSLTTNAIGTPTLSVISNVVMISFFTSLALGWNSIAFLMLVVIKLLSNPLLILDYNLLEKCWNSCINISLWCDMLSLKQQSFTIGLQCNAMWYMPLPCCFMTFRGKMSYMNFGGKIFNGFTWFLIQWYPKLSSLF